MPEKASLAREFYEHIVRAADPVATIRKLYDPADPQVETDYLDFKTYDARSLKDQFRQALCGFSNNQGGVLIWGIDARPQGDPPVDAAWDERPVANPKAIKSRLLELQNGGIDPPVANIEVEAIETAPAEGFVVAYIPDGPYKPYRATDGAQAFWFRSGWSFIPMATSMIRQLFYPRSQAAFQVIGHAHVIAAMDTTGPHAAGSKVGSVDLELSLENIGGGTAVGTFIELSVATRAEFEPHVTAGQPWRMNATNAPVYIFRSRRRIHPKQLEPLLWMDWSIPSGKSVKEYLGMSPQLRMIVYCENQEPQMFFAEIDTMRLGEISNYLSFEAGSVDRLPPRLE